jgi:hypothetical protein
LVSTSFIRWIGQLGDADLDPELLCECTTPSTIPPSWMGGQ